MESFFGTAGKGIGDVEKQLYELWRTNCRGIGGLVDFLDVIEAESEDAAEAWARETFDFDVEAGEELEVNIYEPVRTRGVL